MSTSGENSQHLLRSNLRLAPKSDELPESPPILPRQFVSYIFYKARPTWQQLKPVAKTHAKAEFTAAIREFSASLLCYSYSLTGLCASADFMLQRISLDLETLQQMAARLNNTALGRHLEATVSFLSMTKRLSFVGHEQAIEHPWHACTGQAKYLFVYPLAHAREWYLLPAERRQDLLEEYTRLSGKYRSVQLHTTYSFGLDDQDYVCAFETDDPADLLDLSQELGETQARGYMQRQTPNFTCRRCILTECLDALG